MLKVLDVFKIGDMISVTLEGKGEMIKNGSKLVDEKNNVYEVVSVAMTEHDNPADISKTTTVLIKSCGLEKGQELHILCKENRPE